MLSHRQIPTFFYDAKDFNIIIKLDKEQESQFDNILQQTWKQAEEAKTFRYILNIRSSKSLKGKYRFLAQVYSTFIRRIFSFNAQYHNFS